LNRNGLFKCVEQPNRGDQHDELKGPWSNCLAAGPGRDRAETGLGANLGQDLLQADLAGIGVLGLAVTQAVEMVNYIRELVLGRLSDPRSTGADDFIAGWGGGRNASESGR
jgi:hypothetical protein